MKRTRCFLVLLAATCALNARPAGAQPAPELGQGWLPEFTLAARQILQLAEATPAEKFAWRPAPGVRSIGEVYVHLAIGNLWLLSQAGITSPELAKVPKDPERSITAKADVVAWLQKSLDTVKSAYPAADRQRKVVFFGKDATVEGVFLRILAHNNEHMGQSIAYARMNGVAPPWSR